jgi:hypothetical protein
MKSRIVVTILFLLLSSCATHAQFEEITHSFIGKNSQEVLAYYGPPSQIIPLSSREKVWSYKNESVHYIGSSRSYQPLGGNDYFNTTNTNTSFVPVRSFCTFWFVISPHDTVEKVGDKGNHCVAKKPE